MNSYPSDFIGKLELFEFIELPSGVREEHWLTDTCLVRCIWYPSNESEVPSTILYQHNESPFHE